MMKIENWQIEEQLYILKNNTLPLINSLDFEQYFNKKKTENDKKREKNEQLYSNLHGEINNYISEAQLLNYCMMRSFGENIARLFYIINYKFGEISNVEILKKQEKIYKEYKDFDKFKSRYSNFLLSILRKIEKSLTFTKKCV